MDITINEVTYQYGENRVLQDVNLFAGHGELVALLGPSGCGKTTLLKIIAGLIPLSQGKIFFGDVEMTAVEARKRNAVMVFQNYALFPHLTVGRNVEYGLKVRKIPSAERRERVKRILEIVKLSGLEDRKISQLSGGQQQRVALARSLVVQPDVLLFDEPLSNLDEKLRVSMRQEIRNIQKQADITSIYVTHDQEEAMSIADKIAIMDGGVLQQFGSPREVYERPVNKFVAEFMGDCNFFQHGGKTVMVRPEGLILSDSGNYNATVQWQEYLGKTHRISLDWNGKSLLMDIPAGTTGDKTVYTGDEVTFHINEKMAVEIGRDKGSGSSYHLPRNLS